MINLLKSLKDMDVLKKFEEQRCEDNQDVCEADRKL